jgi:hypothetical protein
MRFRHGEQPGRQRGADAGGAVPAAPDCAAGEPNCGTICIARRAIWDALCREQAEKAGGRRDSPSRPPSSSFPNFWRRLWLEICPEPRLGRAGGREPPATEGSARVGLWIHSGGAHWYRRLALGSEAKIAKKEGVRGIPSPAFLSLQAHYRSAQKRLTPGAGSHPPAGPPRRGCGRRRGGRSRHNPAPPNRGTAWAHSPG